MFTKNPLSDLAPAIAAVPGDVIPGLQKQADGSYKNKLFTLSGGGEYKSYSFNAIQNGGANPPTITVKGNNTIGNVVWTRQGTGWYRGTLAGAFPAGKTFLSDGKRIYPNVIDFGKVSTWAMISFYRVDDNTIELYTQQITNNTSSNLVSQDVTDVDGLLSSITESEQLYEVRVYP